MSERQISDGTKKLITESGRLPDLTIQNLTVLLLGAIPYALLVMAYICAPGFILPFFRNPVASFIVLVLMVWEGLGCYWMSKSRNPFVWIFVVIFGIVPLALAPILGPVILTILLALGPICGGR